MRYLGIDFGLKKIGLAVGDNESYLAMPFELLPGGADAVERITTLAKREGIEAFVVGLPLPTEAHQSETQLERTISFITELEKESGLSVFVVDEQFTSAEARRVRSEQGSDLAEDVLAAMLILQAYFDEQLRQRR